MLKGPDAMKSPRVIRLFNRIEDLILRSTYNETADVFLVSPDDMMRLRRAAYKCSPERFSIQSVAPLCPGAKVKKLFVAQK